MLQTDELVRRYVGGEGMESLSTACEMSRVNVWRRLRTAGVVRVRERCGECGRVLPKQGRPARGRAIPVLSVASKAVSRPKRPEVSKRAAEVTCAEHPLYRGTYPPGSTTCAGCWGVWKGRGK